MKWTRLANEPKSEKVWLDTAFGRYKALVVKKYETTAEVEVVGGGFKGHPNGPVLIVPLERLSPREE